MEFNEKMGDIMESDIMEFQISWNSKSNKDIYVALQLQLHTLNFFSYSC